MLAMASQHDVAMIRLQEKLSHRKAEMFVEDEQNVDVRCFKHVIPAAEEGVHSSAGLNISASTVTSLAGLERFLRIVEPPDSLQRLNSDTETNRIQS